MRKIVRDLPQAQKGNSYLPDAFYSLADSKTMKMDIHVWLSKNKNVMRDPRRLSNGLFISTGLSANSIYSLIKRLLEGCG
ncbi:MAG: hypothetical protein KAX11_03620, partial [Candidatus Aminicenantes bacterium]|nr:hypothetical protein [Candidatus Aminicenantes bacterium]